MGVFTRLLDENDAEIQMKVLDCLCVWKDKFLMPYEQHLKNLCGSDRFREELTTWSLSRESHQIEEHHRAHLVHIVMRILMPKVRKLKKRVSRKVLSLSLLLDIIFKLDIYVCLYVRTYVSMYVCVCVYVYIKVYTLCIITYKVMYVYIRASLPRQRLEGVFWTLKLWVISFLYIEKKFIPSVGTKWCAPSFRISTDIYISFINPLFLIARHVFIYNTFNPSFRISKRMYTIPSIDPWISTNISLK